MPTFLFSNMETVKHSFLSMPICCHAREKTAMLSFAKNDPFSANNHQTRDAVPAFSWKGSIFTSGRQFFTIVQRTYDSSQNA